MYDHDLYEDLIKGDPDPTAEIVGVFCIGFIVAAILYFVLF